MPLKPEWNNIFRIILWLELSKAYFISKKVPKTLKLETRFLCTKLLNKNKASSINPSARNQNWFLENKSFMFMNWNILLLMHFSNILEVDGESAIWR